jgi:HSP20 family protein
VDIVEDGEGLHILVYLPGVDPEKVEVVAEEGVLSVKAERPFEKREGATYHRLEGPYGTFARGFNVPNTFDLSRVQARFRHGVLHLLVPRAEATRPKKIQVQVE